MSAMQRLKQINNLVIYKSSDEFNSDTFLVTLQRDNKKQVLYKAPTLPAAERFCNCHTEYMNRKPNTFLQSGDIVVLKSGNKLGKIVEDYEDKTILRFLPERYGRYSTKELQAVTLKDVRHATPEERIIYLKKEFPWGRILKVHTVGDYIIFEYESRSDGDGILYHTYINYREVNESYHSLDAALAACIAYKYTNSSAAATYFMKMLEVR